MAKGMANLQNFSHFAYTILPIATLIIVALTIGSRVIRLFTSVPLKAWIVFFFLGAVAWYVAAGSGYIR